MALGVVDEPRVEWDAVDLRYDGFKIEVKSSAYCQSWFQRKPSTVQFSIRKAVFWNSETGAYEGEATRSADVYGSPIFTRHKIRQTPTRARSCGLGLFCGSDRHAATRELGTAKSISLAAVKRLAVPCKFDGLKAAVDRFLYADPPLVVVEAKDDAK